MKPRLELVFWRDAFFDAFGTEGAPDDYVVKTVGWVREEGRFLKIVSERLPDGAGERSVTYVPLENVIRRHALELVRD